MYWEDIEPNGGDIAPNAWEIEAIYSLEAEFKSKGITQEDIEEMMPMRFEPYGPMNRNMVEPIVRQTEALDSLDAEKKNKGNKQKKPMLDSVNIPSRTT